MLRAEEVDAADLEAEVGPTFSRSTSLIARALGRAPVPGWLAGRAVDGTVQIDDLLLAGCHFENVRAHLLWDVTRLNSMASRPSSIAPPSPLNWP